MLGLHFLAGEKKLKRREFYFCVFAKLHLDFRSRNKSWYFINLSYGIMPIHRKDRVKTVKIIGYITIMMYSFLYVTDLGASTTEDSLSSFEIGS